MEKEIRNRSFSGRGGKKTSVALCKANLIQLNVKRGKESVLSNPGEMDLTKDEDEDHGRSIRRS